MLAFCFRSLAGWAEAGRPSLTGAAPEQGSETPALSYALQAVRRFDTQIAFSRTAHFSCAG